MRISFVTTMFVLFFGMSAQAGDIICDCPDKSCSEIRISFIPSNPGVYMSVEYSYGEKNLEGFAQVTKDKKEGSRRYNLGKFILVEKDKTYTLPLRDQICR